MRRFQIVQKAVDLIEAVVVPRRPIDAATEEKMREALAGKLRAPYRITFSFVDEIPHSENGKFEDFRSEPA